MNPEDRPGGSSALGATAVSPLEILQRDAARRKTVVKGGGQAQEAGGLLGTETNDLFAGTSFDVSDSDDSGPPRSSFVGEAGDWFETKFQLRICGHRLGAGGAKKVIFALAALLCVFVLVVFVSAVSGGGDDVVRVVMGGSVRAQLTVEADIDYIAPGTAARASFELHFKEDVASQLQIVAERVVIESIAAGSVIVTFSVLPGADGADVDPTVISRVFGGGQQVTVAGFPAAGLLILGDSPATVSQSPSQGGTTAGASTECAEGEWWLEAFDDTSWVDRVVGECVASISTLDGFLSTCGNYKNNGCWGAVGRQCPRALSRELGCTRFSARFRTVLSVDREADYRFFVSMDDRANIKIDGQLVFTSNCEWVGSSCAQQTFDRSLGAGSHEVLVEYVQEQDGAYADLKWVQLGRPCAEDEWRVELYTNEDFTSDPGATIPTTCEPMQTPFADHATGRLHKPDGMTSRSWCPTGTLNGQCDYFSAIYTGITSVPEAGTWLFDLSSSGSSWIALDDVHLTPSGCANLVADRCETSSYSHRMNGGEAATGTGLHKISVFFTHVPEDSDAYMRLDWVFTDAVGTDCGWEVAIYDAPHLQSYIESLCIPGIGEAFLDTSRLAVGSQVSPCNLQFDNGGDCWCPEGLSVLGGDTSPCQHWSATFSRDISLERGGMYRFLSRANLASADAQVVITIDGEQLTYSGCVLSRGICDQSIFETEDLSAGSHSVVVTLDDSGPAHVELEWQQIHHGCAPNQWRVEGMRMDSDAIVSVQCVTYNSEQGFLELPDDFCPQNAAVQTCAVDANHFRAAFTTTASFMEAGIYRFSQRFRDTGVVSIDGVRMLSSGCQNAFGSRCTETTFDHVLTRGDHVISVDMEFEDPQNSKKVLGQLQWENLGTGDCEWQHGDWDSGNLGGASEVRRNGLAWGGLAIDRLGDDDYFSQNLPWPFPFYGAVKQSVRINANGYLTFSGDHHGYGNTAPIPDPGAPNDMIAVYWTDLNPESALCEDEAVDCTIYTYAPLYNPDIFVIQWHEIPFYEIQDGTPVEHCTFSCILHRNGTIEMKYRHVPTPEHAAPHRDYAPVSIGIEGPDGTAGLQVSYNSPIYPDDRVSLVIPQSCNVEQCARNEWFMELFSDTDFSTPVSRTCENFNADGHLLTCPDYRNGGCWCPDSLATYDTHLNYVVAVGPSSTNNVRVTVPGAQYLNVIECGRRPVNYQSPDWSDTFSATPVGGGQVIVTRTDLDGGWGQNLQLLCTVEYTTADTPVAGDCKHFSAILTAPRVKFTEGGLYRFHESSHDEAVVYIDGERVHSAGCDWVGSHCAESEIDVQLTAGTHSLQYSFVAYTGRAYAYLAWEHIANNCAPGEWRQELFDNTDFTSPASPDCHDDACRHAHQPVHVSCQRFSSSEGQQVPFIQTCPRRSGCWCPDGLTLVDGEDHCHHFSARLMSTVQIASGGLYRFHVKADDEAEVFINGELHQSLHCGDGSSSGGLCHEYIFETTLSPGDHSVMFEFVKYEGMGDALLTWERVEGFQCVQLVTAGDGVPSAPLTLSNDKSVIFQLQAAGEAHLIFVAQAGEYHIVLGASTNQAISISKDFMYNQKATAQMPGMLHSYESLPFWASADNGLVRVGMGNTLGVGTLLEWRDVNPLDVTQVKVGSELQYRGNWHLCASAACRPGEWRQELFENADFSDETGVSCVNYDATNSGFLNTCAVVTDSSDQLLSHVDLFMRSREDSAEECEATNQVFLTSSDLELLWDREEGSGGRCSGSQQVALRFRGADIQPESNGLHVRSAILRLTVDEFNAESSRDLTVTIEAEATDDSLPFDGAASMVTSRPRTTAKVLWTLNTDAQVGDQLVSPNLGPVIQEILNRDGWHYGNSITLILSQGSGTGNRWVSADSALLAVDFAEYSIGRAAPGCWQPGGAQFDHDVFSAILTTVIQVDESSRYRFLVDNDDTAAVSISVDGRDVHSSGCEVVGGSCGKRVFDASLDYGTHEVSVRFAEHESQAHLSLSWETVFFDVESMRECYTNSDASDYRGRQAITANGYGCADWASQTPHEHPDYNTAESSPEAGLLDNYCRNPNGRSTAWCYTTDPDVVWDLCLDIGPPSDSCDVCSSNEWFMEVFDNADFSGLMASECFDAGEFLHVSPFCPDVLEGRCDYVSATFTRTIQVGDCSDPFKVCHPGGMYRFFETSGHDSRVFLDGDLIHESVCDSGRCSTHNFEVELETGVHTIMYDLQGYDGVAYVDFKWEHIGNSQCRYRRVDSEWVDATVGTPVPPLEDDDAHTLELPFGFPFYGGVKNRVKVSSNGYLTFSGDHFSYGDTSAVPSTQVPNDFIAPYWTDLNPEAGGEIYYYHYSHVRGERGYRDDVSAESSRSKFIVQWNNIPYYCTAGDCPTVTFQVLLYPSGAIKFQYSHMEPNPNIHGRPVVGIENGEGDAGIMMSHPPEGALNDPTFVGADAFGGSTASMAYYLPQPCEVRDCDAGSWRVEVFRGDDFTLPASTSCRNFETNGFLATSLACGGWMTAAIGWHRVIEPCWCPAALKTYGAESAAVGGRRRMQVGVCETIDNAVCDEVDQSVRPECRDRPGGMCCPAGTDTADCCDASGHVKLGATGQPVSETAECSPSDIVAVEPVVEVIASSSNGVAGYSTYRLSLSLSARAGSVYTIFGGQGNELEMPPAYQVDIPWGTDIGGVNPAFWAVGGHADSQWDSWLTVTDVSGAERGSLLQAVGIDFTSWNTNSGLVISDGAVFWMNPGAAPAVTPAVVAQLTIPQGVTLNARLNAAGRGAGGGPGWADDWQQLGIEFSSAGPTIPDAVASPVVDPCEYFSAIFTTTLSAAQSGRYTIFETSHFSSSVFVDGNQLRSLGCVYRDGQCAENMFSAFLQEGDHEIVVKFVETTGGAFSHVWWQYVGSECDYSHGNYTDAEWMAIDTQAPQPCNRDGTTEIALGGVCAYQSLADDDYVTALLPPGWSFPFYGGHKRDRVRISTNGYLTFSGAHFSYGNTLPIPDIAAPNDMIAPYWTDLNPADADADGGMFTYATESHFVVLWKRIPLWGTDDVATFEVIMGRDGAITFLYEETPSQMLDYAQPSVGLENSDGTQGLRISYADILLPTAGMKISIPESCEHPAAQNGPSQGARVCDDTWSLEVYEGVDFMRADGSSALVSSTCLGPPPSPAAESPPPVTDPAACSASDFSHSDSETGFITDDSQCLSRTCPPSWQEDGECDTDTMPSICPPGTDSADCGDLPSAGCWCPAALNHYNNPRDPSAPPEWVPGQACTCTRFGAIYTRTVWIRTAGLYRFTESSPDEIAIFVDGEHLHRSGCVPGSKTEATHLTDATYTMACTDESTFDVQLTAAQHTLVVSLVHHSNSMTAPPTLQWEFLGTAPCEWSRVPYTWMEEVRNSGQQILGGGVRHPAGGGVTQRFPDSWADGFPFFAGQMHEINVFLDGFMTFQTNETIGDGSTQAFPSPVEPNNIIAPWWVDLDLSTGGGVFVHAPADGLYWAVEWYNLPYFGSGNTVDFQAILRESGQMTFSYKNLPPGPAAHSWAPPSIGLENVAGTDGLRIAYDPDPDQELAPGVHGKPAERSSIEIPTACATVQCGLFHWVVAAYSDLTFSHALHTTCEDWGQGGTDREGMIAAEAFCPVVPNYVAGVDTCLGYSAYFIQNVRFDRSGIYRFTENSPNTVGILFLNDQQVLSSRMEQTDHLVDVRLAAGTYELMYGALHLPAAGPYPAANPQAPSISLTWTARGQSTCLWSSSDDDDDGDSGGADGVGGGAIPFDWVDLSTIGHCEVGSGCPCEVGSAAGCVEIADDGYVEVALPTSIFSGGFPFYGGHKTAVRVSANGYLTFSGEHLSYGDTQAIPSTSLPNDMIAVYWTDLDPSQRGSIYTLADVANDRWIVEWHEIPLWGQADGVDSPTATFQAMLYASGEIRLQYLSTPRSSREGDDVRSSPAVGIENVDGSEGEQIAWNQARFPTARTAITIPSECEVGSRVGECGSGPRLPGECCEGEWKVRVFHDLHFQMAVQTKCEQHTNDGHLQTCPGSLAELQASASGCWCPAGLARYATETYQSSDNGQNQEDPCLYANDNQCDVPAFCPEGSDIHDCNSNVGCTGDSDGFSAIFSSTIQIDADAHGNYVFGALFGARSAATVIIDDDVAFVWDSRLELSSGCTGTLCSGPDEECSCAATPAFVASGLEEDCPTSVGCSFSSSLPPTLQTFDWHLTEGPHSVIVEYVEEAGADSGGNAYLTWDRA